MVIDLSLKIQEVISYALNTIFVIGYIYHRIYLKKNIITKPNLSNRNGLFAKKDYTYWIIILGLFIIVILTDNSVNDSDFNEKIEFAATAVSIVLAVIAILLTLIEGYQNSNVQNKLDASSDYIRDLISELKDVTQKQEKVTKSQEELATSIFLESERFSKNELVFKKSEETSSSEIYKKFKIILVISYMNSHPVTRTLLIAFRRAYSEDNLLNMYKLINLLLVEMEESQEVYFNFYIGEIVGMLRILNEHDIIRYEVEKGIATINEFDNALASTIDDYMEENFNEELVKDIYSLIDLSYES